jgi:hypothetical protein
MVNFLQVGNKIPPAWKLPSTGRSEQHPAKHRQKRSLTYWFTRYFDKNYAYIERKNVSLCRTNHKKIKVMAIPIERTPVLTGKAAEEFYERWANMKESLSKEKVREIQRTTREFMAKQKHLR